MARMMQTCTVGELVTVGQMCQWCHKASSVTVDRTAFDRWMAGELVQTVFAELSASDRETLVSGTHAKCWDEMWGGEE